MGQPIQPPPFPAPPQNQAPAPQFNYPFNVQAPSNPPANSSVDDKLDALAASFQDTRNQVAELTAAVNGLGANTQALHEWVVNQVEQVTTMVGGIVQAIRQEGVRGIVANLISGSQQQPPQTPQ